MYKLALMPAICFSFPFFSSSFFLEKYVVEFLFSSYISGEFNFSLEIHKSLLRLPPFVIIFSLSAFPAQSNKKKTSALNVSLKSIKFFPRGTLFFISLCKLPLKPTRGLFVLPLFFRNVTMINRKSFLHAATSQPRDYFIYFI